MTTAVKIEKITSNGGKKFSKKYVAGILEVSRKTLYRKIRQNDFSAVDENLLKKRGIIN